MGRRTLQISSKEEAICFAKSISNILTIEDLAILTYSRSGVEHIMNGYGFKKQYHYFNWKELFKILTS